MRGLLSPPKRYHVACEPAVTEEYAASFGWGSQPLLKDLGQSSLKAGEKGRRQCFGIQLFPNLSNVITL